MTEHYCGFKRLPDGRYEIYADDVIIGYADDQVAAAVMIAEWRAEHDD